jgi:hypothetical protein
MSTGSTDLAAIAIGATGTMLAIGLVVIIAWRGIGWWQRRCTSADVRVGRFVVTAGSAGYHADTSDRCAAFAFTDPSDETLIASIGVAAVMADAVGVRSGHGLALTAADTFLDSFRRSASTGAPVTEVLRTALTRANERIARVVGGGNSASLAVGAIGAIAVTSSGLYWISMGDVRIYLVRARVVLQVNRDRLDTAPQENAAGPLHESEVDAAPAALPLQSGDYVLVCNAGLHSRLTEDAIAHGVAAHGANCSRALVDSIASLDRDGAGNLSAFHVAIRQARLKRGETAG